MKIDIEQVEATLLERKIDPTKVNDIIKDLIQSVEEEKADNKANVTPKAKFEYIVILNDSNNELKDKELTAWVVQQRDGQDAGLILSKLADAAKAQNEASKRKKTLIKSFIELFDGLKSKFAKEKGLRIKTKDAVRVLVTNGKLL